MPKSWYNPEAGNAVRTVPEVEAASLAGRERRRLARAARLGACLSYPLSDGPGVAMLVAWPPLLLALSLPVFDVVSILEPLTRGTWALGLLALPIFLPLVFSFAMVAGYAMLFLGQVVVAGAMGEEDHPRWPEWNSEQIAEGLARWIWAGMVGLVLGGFPAMLYWINCGTIDTFDRLVLADLAIAGAGYAAMALLASLLHENLLAANPITVAVAIARLGWDAVQPGLSAGVALLLAAGAFWAAMFRTPSLGVAAVALWGSWVVALYLAMVVARMLGLSYAAHAHRLAWFRRGRNGPRRRGSVGSIRTRDGCPPQPRRRPAKMEAPQSALREPRP